MKWIPEAGAIVASVVIAAQTGMGLLEWALLWVALDLMTAKRGRS